MYKFTAFGQRSQDLKTETLLKAVTQKVKLLFLDIGGPDDVIVLAGMGRSGTTWVGDIVNYDNSYRVLFEPFFPTRVKQAREFEYIQYLNPDCDNEIFINQAETILAGKVHNNWVDRDNKRLFYRRRIIKDIRCNLMLGWLKKIANPPVILLIRHPLQIVSSWFKLGWGKEAGGRRSDFDIITSQQSLLKDYPIISDVMKWIEPEEFVENIVFGWCVHHFIPIQQLKKDEAHVVFYENLLIDSENEVSRLFHYLDKPFDNRKLRNALKNSSSTNFLGRDFSKDQSRLQSSWKEEFSAQQIQRTNSILAAFGLDTIYDKDGIPTSSQILRD